MTEEDGERCSDPIVYGYCNGFRTVAIFTLPYCVSSFYGRISVKMGWNCHGVLGVYIEKKIWRPKKKLFILS